MSTQTTRPLAHQLTDVGARPAVPVEAQPWWTAAAQGRLVVERCCGCGQHVFPLRGICPRCWTRSMELVEIRTSGILCSWTVNHQAWVPGSSPYVLGLVEFPDFDGLRFTGPIEDVDPERPDLHVGQEMTFSFHHAASINGPRLHFAPRPAS